ncbi:MAG: gamma-glutamyltransferase [Bdellovibrionales bacterium RBG_16_40_8]|nr:MAG: gamma-glutamyltransferase [Bdellovibrionales bacterium RBG_16_40_8]
MKIAEKGGNPVDVAVALVLAMSVTNATFASLGGGGFALVKMGKSIEVLDFRERAPQATSPNYFKNKAKDASMTGGAAVAVPGIPAGLWELKKKYGSSKIDWSILFDEPIKLAQKGYRVSGEYSEELATNAPRFNAAAKRHFLKNGVTPYNPGEIFVQKNLGRVLSEMRNRNIISFYSGRVAKDIVDTVKAAGGDMTLKDLQDYKPIWRQPLTTNYSGYKLYLMPPPSSGGIVIKTALSLIEKLELAKYPERGIEEYHLLGQILSRAFRGRTMIADPDHQNVDTEKLLSKQYVDDLAKSINLAAASSITPLNENDDQSTESKQTTHLSVMDKFGNAVAMTFTLNGDFGSGVASENFGIMLNNEMDDFTTNPGEPNMFGLVQGQGNMVAPGKRPLSSMSPTLVEKNGKIIMALGAPGGPRIISSVIQVLYRTLGRNQDLELATAAPRVHHQLLPDKLFVDEGLFSPEIIEGLKARKNSTEESWQARIYAVRNVNGVLEAVFDTRGEGAAGGL